MLQNNTRFKLVAAILLFLLAIGCASLEPAKPNDPFVGQYPAKFSQIADENPLLAIELGKLPEFQDGISPAEAIALDKISDLYKNLPEQFDRTFTKMYQVGLPGIRKYCSPLQGLFWLAEDGKLAKEKNLVFQDPFVLQRFLDKAWALGRYPPFPIKMSPKEISVIVAEIKDEDRKNYYIERLEDDDPAMLKAIYLDYNLNSNIFSRKARKILKYHIDNDLRWANFDVVVDRLNAPELVDYYERKRLRYEYYWNISGYSTSRANPRYVFKNNKGDCVYTTAFTVHCLMNAGYHAYEKRVPSHDSRFDFHAFTIFEKEGQKYKMDNGRIFPIGILPYEDTAQQ